MEHDSVEAASGPSGLRMLRQLGVQTYTDNCRIIRSPNSTAAASTQDSHLDGKKETARPSSWSERRDLSNGEENSPRQPRVGVGHFAQRGHPR